jgi:hypothetical protein
MIYCKFVSCYDQNPGGNLLSPVAVEIYKSSHSTGGIDSCERHSDVSHVQEELFDKDHLLSITRYSLICLLQQQSLEVKFDIALPFI